MGGSKNKAGYFDKLKGLLEDYKSIFIVEIDNVSSQQMHEIRHALRGEAVVLMGKNTMVCRCAAAFGSGSRVIDANIVSLRRFVVLSRPSRVTTPSTSVSFPTLRATSVSSSPTPS